MGAADTPTRAPLLAFAAAAPPLPTLAGPCPQDFASHEQPQHDSSNCEYKLRCGQPSSAIANWFTPFLSPQEARCFIAEASWCKEPAEQRPHPKDTAGKANEEEYRGCPDCQNNLQDAHDVLQALPACGFLPGMHQSLRIPSSPTVQGNGACLKALGAGADVLRWCASSRQVRYNHTGSAGC